MNVSLALGRGRVPTPPRPSPAPGDLLRPVDVVWFCLIWFGLVFLAVRYVFGVGSVALVGDGNAGDFYGHQSAAILKEVR